MSQDKIHFIGGGQMAEAIIKALIKGNSIAANAISVSDIDSARLQLLHRHYDQGKITNILSHKSEIDRPIWV